MLYRLTRIILAVGLIALALISYRCVFQRQEESESSKITTAPMFDFYAAKIRASDASMRHTKCAKFLAKDQTIHGLARVATPYLRGYYPYHAPKSQVTDGNGITLRDANGLINYSFDCENDDLIGNGHYIFRNKDEAWNSIPLLPGLAYESMVCQSLQSPTDMVEFAAQCEVKLKSGIAIHLLRLLKSPGLLADIVISADSRAELSIQEFYFIPDFLYRRGEARR